MSNEMAKGTVEWEGRRITVEGSPAFVSAELDRFRNAAGTTQPPGGDVEDRSAKPMSDAAFVGLKQPQDHFEKIAVLAVRLHDSGLAEFTADDMRRAYLRAGIKPPKVMSQALVDTKRKKDYIEPTATRGAYRLTTFGSDFVQFELPRQGGSKS